MSSSRAPEMRQADFSTGDSSRVSRVQPRAGWLASDDELLQAPEMRQAEFSNGDSSRVPGFSQVPSEINKHSGMGVLSTVSLSTGPLISR